MRVWCFTLFLHVAILHATSLHAACRLSKGEMIDIAKVTETGALMLADGRELKLANVELPPSSVTPLSTLVEGRRLALSFNGKRQDRHGRLVGFPMLEEKRSLQSKLVEDGLARVSVSRDNRTCAPELMLLEQRARADGRGLWVDPAYAVRDAGDSVLLAKLEGSYQLVEGTIARAAVVRNRLFVNFGSEAERDFTMTVAPSDARLFKRNRWERTGHKLPGLEGEKIRIRGWMSSYGGPEIIVTVPEQVEFLSDKGKTDTDSGSMRGKPRRRK